MSGPLGRTAWKNSNVLPILMERLNDATKPSDSGSIQFVAQDHRELFDLLADLVVGPDDVNRNDISAITYRSFLDLRRNACVRPKGLISEIAKRVADLKRQPPKKYTMWTKLRLAQLPFAKASRVNCSGVKIRTAASLPKWLNVEPHFISGVGDVEPNSLPFYGYLILTTDARTTNEGTEKIFAALEKFYAIVNTAWRFNESWTQRRPTAVLLHGPNYFFFKGKSCLGKNRVWYNQDYDREQWESFPKDAKTFRAQLPTFRRALRKLEDHPLRIPIERALILVNEGMMSGKLSFRLMRFWSAAEALFAAKNERTSYGVLIDRMVFAEVDDQLQIERLKLKHAYQLRNQYVHDGLSENDDSMLTQNLRETILRFAYYLLFNGDDFESHGDLLMMIDPSNAPQKVQQKLTAITRRKLIVETGRHRKNEK